MKKSPAAQNRRPAAHFVDCKYDEKATKHVLFFFYLKDLHYASPFFVLKMLTLTLMYITKKLIVSFRLKKRSV